MNPPLQSIRLTGGRAVAYREFGQGPALVLLHGLAGASRSCERPALVIAGEHDRVARPEVTLRLAALIPGAERVVLEGAGHAPYLETPAAYNAVLRDFLRRVRAV